jgi:hypothetical protein
MVQHVTIVPKPLNPGEPEAHPHTVVIWRDDQTIKWGLHPNYSWPNPVTGEEIVPIVFLPADPARGYLDWPGSAPVPIGTRPAPGTPDTRFYTASSDKILPPGAPPEKYHYAFAVCPRDTPNCMLEIHPMLEAPRSQQRLGDDGLWYDPDVENQSLP